MRAQHRESWVAPPFEPIGEPLAECAVVSRRAFGGEAINRNVEGMTVVLGHCRFRWFEPASADGRRIFLLKRKHCERCFEELRRQWPSATYVQAAIEDTEPGPVRAA
jgi:hypothetical protein